MGSKFCTVVSNGTAALHLVGLVEKWNKDDLILTSPISFLASASCVIYNNAKIDFIDIDEDTYTLNIEKLEKKLKVKKNVKAVIAVDYAGHPCDWKKLKSLSIKYNFKLINDNCHAIGAKYFNRFDYAIKYADYVTHSYHPVKNITTGEGGAIFTNIKKSNDKLKIFRSHGMLRNKNMIDYSLYEIGYNYRLTDIQCALGISQLTRLKFFIKKRRSIAKKYDNFFKKYNFVKIPMEKKFCTHSYHLYPLLINFERLSIDKKKLISIFKKNNIFLQVHYFPIHLQPYYKKRFKFKVGDFKVAENFYKEEISLPIYPDLKQKDQSKIIGIFKKIFKKTQL
jgi:dTDP-4-amino-4,6-dideoxygalactose transaminase